MKFLLDALIALDVCVFITFLLFRMLGIIMWSMVWILAPIWIPVVIITVVYLLLCLIAKEID